jgi:hypothetical protein
LYFRVVIGTLVIMPTDHLTCPYCAGDDLTPFPDPTSAWSCLGCTRVIRVEVVQPASVTGWGVLRVVAPHRTAAAA